MYKDRLQNDLIWGSFSMTYLWDGPKPGENLETFRDKFLEVYVKALSMLLLFETSMLNLFLWVIFFKKC